MSDYEAKAYYKSSTHAESYNSQYESPLRLANLRAKLVGWRESVAFASLLEHAPQGGSVLDIACGTGRHTEQLLAHGYKTGGLDISSEMLVFARARIIDDPNLLFLEVGDAEDLPFEDQQFDGVACMRLYHRVPPEPRRKMLREVKRVGRGWAILFFGMSTTWLSLRRTVRSTVLRGRPNNPYPVSPAKLVDELQGLGLTVRGCRWVLPGLSEGMLVLVTW